MKTILVLEDEAMVTRLFHLALRGYNIVEAATAAEALRHFCNYESHIDLLIADLALATTGINVPLRLRSVLPTLPVILASDCPQRNWTDQNSDALGRLGTDSVTILQKPFFPSVVLHKVHEMIGAPVEVVASTGRAGG
jgi:CheY-like chemotaxis protein